ncbi:MAG: small ribosomal subunit protein uS17 [Metamycoplasmataceae bacterium]
MYNKRFKQTKRFPAHDEQSIAKLGDIVKITSTRPISKTKNFRLEKIREHAKEGK